MYREPASEGGAPVGRALTEESLKMEWKEGHVKQAEMV